MNTGKKITKYRQEARLTQAQLAKMSGISEDYLKAIESGKKFPHIKTIARIANTLGVNIDELMGEDN